MLDRSAFSPIRSFQTVCAAALLFSVPGFAVENATLTPTPAAAPEAKPVVKAVAPTTSIKADIPQPVVADRYTPPPAVEGEPEIPRAILVTKRELTAQLQIFLDQQMFSPGMIDGKPGKFITMALRRWQNCHGLPETGVVDANVPLDSVYPVYTFHTVAKGEQKYIGDVPGKPVDQEKRKYLPYSSYVEYLAERYHCSTEFLLGLNKGLSFGKIKIGDQVRVPNVEPFKLETMPDTGNYAEQPEFKTRRIVVNRRDTILELYENNVLIASIPIAPGSPAHPTPVGKWRILGVAAMPTFRWDAGVLNRGVRTDTFFNLPAGPNNPVGVGWIALNKLGIGIHGTNNPYSIGTWASHGCMRSANWDIARLSKMVTKDMAVEIQ